MLERVVQALKTRLFRAKYPKLASPLRNYSQFLYFFPSTSNFSSSSLAYRAICPNFVTARSQLTEQMNRNAAKGSELIREFDKTRSLSRQFHGWKSWGGGRFREEEMEKREREKKIRRGGRNSIEKFSLVLPGGHRRQRREIVFRMRWLQLVATLQPRMWAANILQGAKILDKSIAYLATGYGRIRG